MLNKIPILEVVLGWGLFPRDAFIWYGIWHKDTDSSRVLSYFCCVLSHARRVSFWNGVDVEVGAASSVELSQCQDGPYIVAAHCVVVPVTIGIYYIVDFNDDTQHDIFVELLLTGLVCVACVAAERATTSSIHASIQAQSSRALTAAVDTLLSSVCDAVVNLTHTYEFSQDCPRQVTGGSPPPTSRVGY